MVEIENSTHRSILNRKNGIGIGIKNNGIGVGIRIGNRILKKKWNWDRNWNHWSRDWNWHRIVNWNQGQKRRTEMGKNNRNRPTISEIGIAIGNGKGIGVGIIIGIGL